MNDETSNEHRPQAGTVTFKRKGYTTIADTAEHQALVEEFREYYLEERKSGRTDLMQIFREFRKHCQLYKHTWFNPYPNQMKILFRRYESELPLQIRKIPIKRREVQQQVASQNKTELVKEIAYHDLEDGAKSLQATLLKDAEALIEESNQDYELIDQNGGLWDKSDYEKIRIKKKALALGIAKDVLAGVHKNTLLSIKKNKEGRETAGFLLDIMRQASAGELNEEHLKVLDTGIPT